MRFGLYLFLCGHFCANAAFRNRVSFQGTAHNWGEFYVYRRDYTVVRELIKYRQPPGLIKSFQTPPDLVKDMVPGKLRPKQLWLDSSSLLHAHKGTSAKKRGTMQHQIYDEQIPQTDHAKCCCDPQSIHAILFEIKFVYCCSRSVCLSPSPSFFLHDSLKAE